MREKDENEIIVRIIIILHIIFDTNSNHLKSKNEKNEIFEILPKALWG